MNGLQHRQQELRRLEDERGAEGLERLLQKHFFTSRDLTASPLHLACKEGKAETLSAILGSFFLVADLLSAHSTEIYST